MRMDADYSEIWRADSKASSERNFAFLLGDEINAFNFFYSLLLARKESDRFDLKRRLF